MPLVSVVIPVYNVEATLMRTIKSVENQNFDELQIVLVDDGSTDSSGGMCDNLAEGNPKIKVIHQENKGLSEARNTGIRDADGKYILFLDSDDEICTDCLREMYDTAERFNADAVGGGMTIIDMDSNQTIEKKWTLDEPKLFEKSIIRSEFLENFFLHKNKDINSGLYLNLSSLLIKKSVVEDKNLFFAPEQTHGEDTRFVLQMLGCINNFVAVPCGCHIYYQSQLVAGPK